MLIVVQQVGEVARSIGLARGSSVQWFTTELSLVAEDGNDVRVLVIENRIEGTGRGALTQAKEKY